LKYAERKLAADVTFCGTRTTRNGREERETVEGLKWRGTKTSSNSGCARRISESGFLLSLSTHYAVLSIQREDAYLIKVSGPRRTDPIRYWSTVDCKAAQKALG